jgi:hypothetical protein
MHKGWKATAMVDNRDLPDVFMMVKESGMLAYRIEAFHWDDNTPAADLELVSTSPKNLFEMMQKLKKMWVERHSLSSLLDASQSSFFKPQSIEFGDFFLSEQFKEDRLKMLAMFIVKHL